MRSPVKTYFPDRRRPIEKPSIIPVLLWITIIVVSVAIAWWWRP